MPAKNPPLDPDEVRQLETVCERALASALKRHFATAPSARLMHLMAKAAVAVLEAAPRRPPAR